MRALHRVNSAQGFDFMGACPASIEGDLDTGDDGALLVDEGTF